MGERLILRFDEIGSLMFIEVCAPYAEQDSNEIGESVVARFNLETGEMESVEVLFFDSWLKKKGEIRIPVSASMRPSNSANVYATAPSAANAPMTVKYDGGTDTLYLDLREPCPGQTEVEICDGALARLNPETGGIESLAIHPFKTRAERDGKITLPISATFLPVKSAVTAD